MAELGIDREDVHDRKKWRTHVMKRKSNPIGKDCKTIIYIDGNKSKPSMCILLNVHEN